MLTLWAAVVAKRLGYAWPEALTLGRAVAGLNAQSKGRSLGIFRAAESGAPSPRRRPPAQPGERVRIELFGRSVPAVHTPDGLRAIEKEKPSDPASVERYLESKFGDDLAAARAAMEALAASQRPTELAAGAFSLYEAFRPSVPRGARGWGAAGTLDLALIRALAEARPGG